MNAARAAARAERHALRQPDRARRRRATTPRRATSCADAAPARVRVLPRNRRARAGDAATRATARARSRTATALVRSCRRSTASRPATPSRRATCSSARARQRRDHADLRRARRAQRRRARVRHAAAARLGLQPLPAGARRGRRARCSRARRSATAGRRARPDRRRQLAPLRRAQGRRPLRRCGLDAPAEVEGPIRRGQALGKVKVLPRRQADRHAARSSPPPTCRRPARRCARRTGSRGRCTLVLVVLLGLGGSVLLARRAATRPEPPPRVPCGQGAGSRMIITVTLNTAIDKTLAVPNFRLGRRHRTVEQTSMPGGKGVNVARVLKTLGQPVIATGLAGGADRHAHRRAADRSSRCSDFVRIGEESRTNTAVIDPTTGEQTEINERGPRVTRARGRAVRRQAALPGQGRERVRVRRLAAARRRRRRLRAPDPRARAPRRHAWSTPTATRCAAPCAPSPT